MGLRWCLNDLASLHWRCWEEQWVVFDAGSGQTHCIDALTAAILSRIEREPADTEALIASATQESGINNHAVWSKALNPVLDRLVDSGLIELITR